MRVPVKFLVGTAFAVLPICAHAQLLGGGSPYVSVEAGYAQVFEDDLEAPGVVVTGVGNTTSNEFAYDDGFGLIGAIGYKLNAGPRIELELGYRENELEFISGFGGGGAATNGEVSAVTGMANVLLDLEFGGPARLKNFIGAGLGVAYVEYEDTGRIFGTRTLSDDDTSFAYQGIIGTSYDISPQVTIMGTFRYLVTEDLEFDVPGVGTSEIDYRSNLLTIGLRYNFAPPPPPVREAPPPAPAPAPVERPIVQPEPQREEPAAPENYIVFFEFDRSNLTREAQRIVREAAENAIDGNVSRILVTGHADRSGSNQYNEALSRRRADAVAAALVELGVRDADIETVARGERDPLVPTPDGVREPQNRRVVIEFEGGAGM